MKMAARGLLMSFSVCAGAAVVQGLDGATGTNVTITNLEEKDDYIVVTFSAALNKGAACAAQHRNSLLINSRRSALADTARHAFSLGQAVDVWGGAVCSRVSDYETMSIMQIAK
ncbi:MAG: hypothetical protein JSR36_07510 [Proteobacteria bacterium]|nr:hypothetical protein [Pseudomonadota bacterium]